MPCITCFTLLAGIFKGYIDVAVKQISTLAYAAAVKREYNILMQINLSNVAADVVVSYDKRSIKICDFGLAKDLKEDKFESIHAGPVVSTKVYSAPEVVTGQGPASKYSDMWSMGCTLIELFSGHLVWGVPARNESSDKFLKDIYQARKSPAGILVVPVWLRYTVSNAMAYKSSIRCTAEELLEEFE
ncbi:hypothetical protein QAD02_017976 [Eretmocerus hayati]|uniref:Uncharacterized protein n=1 Tax=Eretmocerus hayati TaxID=131215 RepID=A0ACC2PFV1_9HYME|nr:hypothetical protein QAD02_017976 [Eretmocerus hayati]